MKAPVPRYEQAARRGEDAIRRLRELAPPYEQLGNIEAAILALLKALSEYSYTQKRGLNGKRTADHDGSHRGRSSKDTAERIGESLGPDEDWVPVVCLYGDKPAIIGIPFLGDPEASKALSQAKSFPR